MARDLTAFFRIANMINSTRDVQALQRELLELICEVIRLHACNRASAERE